MSVHVSPKQALFAFFAIALTIVLGSCGPAVGESAELALDPALSEKSDGVLTHEEYLKAPIGETVTIEAYIQDIQGNPDTKVSLYLQDPDGGYFAFDVVCTPMVYNSLSVGGKVRIEGEKFDWYGEEEINNGTVTILDGDTYIAPVLDVTDIMGTADLREHLNEKVLMRGLTIEPSTDPSGASVPYIVGYNGKGDADDDLFFMASKDGKAYNFTVESDLAQNSMSVYRDLHTMKIGDVVDIESILYWYDTDYNPHAYHVALR